MSDGDDGGDVWLVPVAKIVEHWDPFEAWCDDPISREEVEAALAAGRLDPRPFDAIPRSTLRGEDERSYHAARIAWLMTHPDPTPIVIDVGAPDLGWHPRGGAFDFIDGNHRLCAAILRGDDAILVGYGGDRDAMAQAFPGGGPTNRRTEAA
jgi:hypothetical protein